MVQLKLWQRKDWHVLSFRVQGSRSYIIDVKASVESPLRMEPPEVKSSEGRGPASGARARRSRNTLGETIE